MARQAKPKLRLVPNPSQTPNVAPEPAQDATEAVPEPPKPPKLTAAQQREALKALVEDTRARSRAALEAKVEKLKAKERKRANLSSDMSYREQRSGALRLEQVWRDHMGQLFPNVPQMAWFKREGMKLSARKEGKLVADLIDGYGDEKLVEEMLVSYVKNWSSLFGPMLTKQGNTFPTIGLFYASHATVMAETVRLRSQHDAVAQYEAWKAEHASDPFAVPPPELEAAYKATLAVKRKP